MAEHARYFMQAESLRVKRSAGHQEDASLACEAVDGAGGQVLAHCLYAEENDWNRAISGNLFLVLYSRARHSDVSGGGDSPTMALKAGAIGRCDQEFARKQTLVKRNDLLPVKVSALRKSGCLLRGWCELACSGLRARGVISSECTTMLKLMLQRGGSDVSLVRSHSLKRTILDWGSKFCIDEAILALLSRMTKVLSNSARKLACCDICKLWFQFTKLCLQVTTILSIHSGVMIVTTTIKLLVMRLRSLCHFRGRLVGLCQSNSRSFAVSYGVVYGCRS